jgi:hypothetical protein
MTSSWKLLATGFPQGVVALTAILESSFASDRDYWQEREELKLKI